MRLRNVIGVGAVALQLAVGGFALAGDAAAEGVPTCQGVAATIVLQSNAEITFGTFGRDVVVGTSGQDVFEGRGGDDLVCLGDGDDQFSTRFQSRTGFPGSSEVYGGPGDDVIVGYAGGDRLYGGGGADTLSGMGGDDRLSGGAGRDTLLGMQGHDDCDGGAGRDRAPLAPGGPCEVKSNIP